ncbi:MAG: glycosyltransferase [Candidatus Micrarchaeaceae archaeon]
MVKMRIAFIADVAYPWHVGGIEIINYNEAMALKVSNSIDFFTMRWPGMEAGFMRNGIRYHSFGAVDKESLYSQGRRSIKKALLFSVGLLRIFKHRFNVVISNQFPVLHLPVLYLFCKLTRCKLVLEVVEVWDRDYWISYLGSAFGSIGYLCYSATMKVADHYIANSSTTADLLAGCGIERKKITVFTPILDDKLVSGIKARRERKIVFAGRLIKEKRLDKWLRIVNEVNKSVPIRAVIIGNGPEKAAVEKIIKELGLSEVVEMAGFFKTKKELYKEIKGADAFLLMSEREGLGVVAVESVALGTPVFVPDYSPLPKEVKEMCIVENEEKIPDVLKELVKSGNKAAWIRNTQNLEAFKISMIPNIYQKIFSKIGL